MIVKLQRAMQRVERNQEKFCAEVQKLAPEALHFREREGAWTPLEVLDHLMRTEKAISAQLSQNRGSKRRIPIKDKMRMMVVRGVMHSPIRVRTPKSAAAVLPGEEKEFDVLTKEWTVQHQVMKIVLAMYTAKDARGGVFKHPIGGWNTVHGALKFINSHIVHHRYQLNRIVKAAEGHTGAPRAEKRRAAS